MTDHISARSDAGDDSPYRRSISADPPAAASRPKATAPAPSTGDGPWERRLIEDLVRESLIERRRSRRWKIGLRLLTLVAIGGIALAAWSFMRGSWHAAAGPHTALIEIRGVLRVGGEVEAEKVVAALQAAFADRNTAGVVLRLNSPGGSPVQAGIIYDEIKRLRKLNSTVPVYAVVEEICASGGYYIAAAADRIFVDKASLIGSIGVLIDGFGATGLIDKLGVERRLITAGSNKGFLDPFSPVMPEQREHAQRMVDEIHRQFINVVREGRGNRLREAPEMFTGLVWTGERGIELGLADEYGTIESVARDVIKAETVLDFTREDSLAERLVRRMGAAAGSAIADRLQSEGGELRLR